MNTHLSGLFSLLLFLVVGCTLEQNPIPKDDLEQEKVYYQIFVRSFYDTNGDGIGDLRGVIKKLDYLDSLGVNGLWLLPIHPSPSYHKYDVLDYRAIDPEYGTLDDFRLLLEEAHERGFSVILDMVINHTDDEHLWFQEALKSVASPYRDYYVWTAPDTGLQEQHLWHEQPADGTLENISDSLFYGFFWKGMPDLNYENPMVRREVVDIARFWIEEVGVDGFRLDAALHIYPFYQEPKERHFQQTVEWWRAYRASLDSIQDDTYLVGEVWASDSVIAPFLEDGLSACFNFDLSKMILGVVQSGVDTVDLVAKLLSQHELYSSYDPNFQDAIFLTNHDQERVRSVFKEDWQRAKLAASILLTLPGTPYIYYGEELGMLGEKPDESIREPMPWDFPGKDNGQTQWEPLLFNHPKATPPLSAQRTDAHSLYAHYQKLLNWRRHYPSLRSRSLQPVEENTSDSLLTYYRIAGKDTSWVLHNLSSEPLRVSVRGNWRLAGEKERYPGGSLKLEPFGTKLMHSIPSVNHSE